MSTSRRLHIGRPAWVKDLKELTQPLGTDFWSGFSPVSAAAIATLEKEIGRKLPEDFIEFYREVGCGKFPIPMGGFYSPEEIAAGLSSPIYFVLGSLFTGKEWCTADAHRKLWMTRGAFNPSPQRFTPTALTLDGVPLFDLLEFGWDGMGCCHQLYVGPPPNPLAYCLLTDSQEMEDRTATFSEAVETIVQHHLDFAADQ